MIRSCRDRLCKLQTTLLLATVSACYDGRVTVATPIVLRYDTHFASRMFYIPRCACHVPTGFVPPISSMLLALVAAPILIANRAWNQCPNFALAC